MEKEQGIITGVEVTCPPYNLDKMRNDIFKAMRKNGIKVPNIKNFKSITIPFKEMDRSYDVFCKVTDNIFTEANEYFCKTVNRELREWDAMGPGVICVTDSLDDNHIIIAEQELMGDITIRSTDQKDINEIEGIIKKHYILWNVNTKYCDTLKESDINIKVKNIIELVHAHPEEKGVDPNTGIKMINLLIEKFPEHERMLKMELLKISKLEEV